MTKKVAAPVGPVQYPLHISGKFCGADWISEGKLSIAPTYTSKFQKLSDESKSVDALLAAVTNHCQNILENNMKRSRELWHDIQEDYSLPDNQNLSYSNGVITVEPKAPAGKL